MQRFLRPCANPRCKNLSRGCFCPQHKAQEEERAAERFKKLKVVSNDLRKFYRSRRWSETSKLFRALNPLCAEHKRRGKIAPATLVHHIVPVEELLAEGIDPCNFEYLEGLCHNCHQKELAKKRNTNASV